MTGLSQGYCFVSPFPTVLPPPTFPQCTAKFIYPIIMPSLHVSSTVSTPQLCLALACHHTEPLPLLWIPRGVRSKDIFPPIPVYILCHSVAWYIFTSGLMYTDKVQAGFILIHSVHFMVADDLFYNTVFVNRGDRV